MSLMKAQVDKLLSNVSNAYQSTGFVSELILPVISPAQYSGMLGSYGNNHLKLEMMVAGGLGKYKNVNPITTNMTPYNIGSYGLEGFVSSRDRANYDAPFEAERDLTAGLTSLLVIMKEVSLSQSLSNPAIIPQGTTLAGVNQWNDYTNSNPIADINAAKMAIKLNTGVLPNFMIMDWSVANTLKYHPKLLDNLGFNFARPGGLSSQEIAMAFDIMNIYVPTANYDSAKEGQPSVFVPIWGKNVIMGYAPPSAAPFQASVGYRLQKSGTSPRRVFKYQVMNPPDTTAILVDDEFQFFITMPSAGYRIMNAIA